MLTYDELYDEIRESVFYDHVRQEVDASVGMNLFGVKKDMRKTIVARNAHTPTGFAAVAKGEDYPNMTNDEGDTLSTTQQHFAGNVVVSKDDRKFIMRNEEGEADITDIEDLVKGSVDDGMDKIDQSLADTLLFGFVDSYTDVYGRPQSSFTPDGVRLFSANHTLPGLTGGFSNLVSDGTNNNPALSRTALVKTIAAARKFKGANGIARGVELDTLVVGPDLVDFAERLINSDKVSGSNDNDTNTHLKRLKIVPWTRLSADSAGTDTSAHYFLCNSKKLKSSGIKVHTAQFLEIAKSKEATANQDWFYPLDAYYAIARNEPQFIYGSTGVN